MVSSNNNSMSSPVDTTGLYMNDPVTNFIMGEEGNYAPVSQGEVVYYNGAVPLLGYVSKDQKDAQETTKKNTDAGGDMMDWWDIAQSHFFTVQIYSNDNGLPTGLHDENGQAFSFSSGEGVYRNYIPIKTMSFTYTSYDNMNIPFGTFGDFPLLHRRKVTTINFSCYDIDQDAIEKAIKYWEQQCFPNGLYAAYLDEIKATLKYTSYDVKGRENFTRVLDVIPTGSMSVNRSYEENAAKMLNFSVVAIGATGASAGAGEMIKERGWGDGHDHANRTYEMTVSAIPWTGRYIDPTVLNYAD